MSERTYDATTEDIEMYMKSALYKVQGYCRGDEYFSNVQSAFRVIGFAIDERIAHMNDHKFEWNNWDVEMNFLQRVYKYIQEYDHNSHPRLF